MAVEVATPKVAQAFKDKEKPAQVRLSNFIAATGTPMPDSHASSRCGCCSNQSWTKGNGQNGGWEWEDEIILRFKREMAMSSSPTMEPQSSSTCLSCTLLRKW